jgi:chemotaxis response regulator CheB
MTQLAIQDFGNIPPVYTEVLDFLIQLPSPQEIAVFKVSTQAQERLRLLLEKNSLGTITQVENSELDIYEQLDQLMTLLKAKADQAIS